MQDGSKVVAVIPARGGSKGVLKKNIRMLGDIPLVGYSIRTALASKHIDRVIVSTDCEEVAEVSRSLGAEVPFLRPQSLAGDRSVVCDAVFYTLAKLREEGYCPTAVVDLYPTHPFRTVKMVDSLIEKVFEGYTPVKTVRRVTHDSVSAFRRSSNGFLEPLLSCAPRHYYRPYALFVGKGINSEFNPYVKVVDDPIALIDIDTEDDFKLAERVVGNGLFKLQAA
jgi:N-acylneuraminate cytidylyltransferase